MINITKITITTTVVGLVSFAFKIDKIVTVLAIQVSEKENTFSGLMCKVIY